MEYTKTVWKDLPDTSTPNTADKLNNIENGDEQLYEGENLQDATPEIMNATMTYTAQECKYKYINKNTIIGTTTLRGNITAISSPAYARINLNIPNINLRTWSSIAIIQEAMNCTDVTPYSATFVENNTISLQREGGTAATNWKVANSVYIKVGFIINLN